MSEVSAADRPAMEQTALELADRWIAERGGLDAPVYGGFAHPWRGDRPEVILEIAYASLRDWFRTGYDWVESRGRDFLRSPAYAQTLLLNDQQRALNEARQNVYRDRGYKVSYLTPADIEALERGFFAAAAYDDYISGIGRPKPKVPITTTTNAGTPPGLDVVPFIAFGAAALAGLLAWQRWGPKRRRGR